MLVIVGRVVEFLGWRLILSFFCFLFVGCCLFVLLGFWWLLGWVWCCCSVGKLMNLFVGRCWIYVLGVLVRCWCCCCVLCRLVIVCCDWEFVILGWDGWCFFWWILVYYLVDLLGFVGFVLDCCRFWYFLGWFGFVILVLVCVVGCCVGILGWSFVLVLVGWRGCILV